MKSHCLLLFVLCSVIIIQDAYSGKLKTGLLTPATYQMQIKVFPNVRAKDVGAGADGTLWYISDTLEGTNYVPYRMKPTSTFWDKIPGQRGIRISVDPKGNAWVVTKENTIHKYVGIGGWNVVEGTAADISLSPDGLVYKIGTNNVISMLNRDGKTWDNLTTNPGNGICIAGGLSRSAWLISGVNTVYRTVPGSWEKIEEQGTDVAVGGNGQTWLLTTGSAPDQFFVYDDIRQEFVRVPVSEYLASSGVSFSNSPTVRIAVASNGDLLGVKEDLSMFRLSFKYTL